MEYDEKWGYYVSDGSLWAVNDQSENERSYVIVPSGARVVYMKNPDANPNSNLFIYTVREGPEPYVNEYWHTTTSGGQLEWDDQTVLSQGARMIHGKLYYYVASRWWTPEPVPVSGLKVYNYDPSFSASQRLQYALSILVPNLYDKKSFLCGLMIGRVLWHQLIGGQADR